MAGTVPVMTTMCANNILSGSQQIYYQDMINFLNILLWWGLFVVVVVVVLLFAWFNPSDLDICVITPYVRLLIDFHQNGFIRCLPAINL